MNHSLRLGLVALPLLLAGAAAFGAEPGQPLDPYGQSSQAASPQAPQPPSSAAPAAPPAGTTGYEPPENVPPPPPENAPPPPPENVPPPPVYNPYAYPSYSYAAPVAPKPRPTGVRHFSLGVHGEVLGINQTVGTHSVVMGGAGIQLRLRTSGRFGFEAAQGFLYTSYLHGGFERSSYPFTLSFLFYVFPNRDSRHFNFYGIAGFGAVADSVQVADSFNQKVSEDFLEWEGHVGAGVEWRYKWISVAADGRFVGLERDDGDAPVLYYTASPSGPVADHSHGGQGNLYVSFWF